MQVVFDDNDHYDFLTRKNYLYKLKLGPHYVQKKKKYANDMWTRASALFLTIYYFF